MRDRVRAFSAAIQAKPYAWCFAKKAAAFPAKVLFFLSYADDGLAHFPAQLRKPRKW